MFNSVDDIPADLVWLAENVHEWPASESARIYWSDDEACFIGDCTISHNFHIPGGPKGLPMNEYTRDQWQAARDLISGKPGWGKAPEGARIRVQDADGFWFFGTYKNANPAPPGWHGCGPGSWHDTKVRGTILGNWRDTLEHKPADEPTPEEDDHFAGPTSSEDIGNALLDGDAPHTKVDPCASPVTFADLDQPLVSTVARELRVTHSDGHIDVEYLFEGGVMLTDDQGGETQIPDEETLTAVYQAALRVLRGES